MPKKGKDLPLSGSEEAFVKALMKPENRSYSAAFRDSQDCSGLTPHNVRVKASRMRQNVRVIAALDKARAKVEIRRVRDTINDRRRISESLWAEVESPSTPSAAKIGALRLLGLEAGMFSEKSVVSHSVGELPQSRGDILDEVESLLGELPQSITLGDDQNGVGESTQAIAPGEDPGGSGESPTATQPPTPPLLKTGTLP